MITTLSNFKVSKWNADTFQITAFVVSPTLCRNLEGWISSRSMAVKHLNSSNPLSRHDAYVQLAELLLEQNSRFDEYAGELRINPARP